MTDTDKKPPEENNTAPPEEKRYDNYSPEEYSKRMLGQYIRSHGLPYGNGYRSPYRQAR